MYQILPGVEDLDIYMHANALAASLPSNGTYTVKRKNIISILVFIPLLDLPEQSLKLGIGGVVPLFPLEIIPKLFKVYVRMKRSFDFKELICL